MVGELLGQEIVAARRTQCSVINDMFDPGQAVGAWVDQAVVDPDLVHPTDPLGGGRGVREMQDD
jgi:hypothetical protein